MPDLLTTLQARHPASQAVLATPQKDITLGTVTAMADALAEKLRDRRIDLLALYADNGPAWIVADLVCQRLGICLVPLPTFFSPLQIRTTLVRCNAQWLLTDTPDALRAIVASSDSAGLEQLALSLCHINAGTGRTPAIPEHTGKITFTSGSTGEAKGVCLSNPQLLQQAEALREVVGLEAPTHLCLLPLSTLLENVAGVYAPLLAGGKVVVPSLAAMGYHGSRLVAPEKLLFMIHWTAPDTLILIPELLKLLVLSVRAGWQAPDSLKFIAVGGAKVGTALLQEAWSLGLPVYEGYGLSECASVVSLNTPAGQLVGSCGKVLPHLSVAVHGGELVVSGNAMLGYMNQPDSWYPDAIHTGDLGYCDSNGFLHLAGRRKHLLISSYGRNISPEWPESEVLANPRLQDVVVFGDGQPYCVALISAREPQLPDADIQTWLDKVNMHLPDYARIRAWHRLEQPLVTLPGMLTANGRPKREAIARKFATALAALYAGAPADTRTASSTTPVSATHMEQQP